MKSLISSDTKRTFFLAVPHPQQKNFISKNKQRKSSRKPLIVKIILHYNLFICYPLNTVFENDIIDLIDPAHRPPAGFRTEPDNETPLLFHANLAGILTIGTLGYSHPLFLPQFSEEQNLELPEKEIKAATKPPPQIILLQPATDHSFVEIRASEDQKILSEPLLKEVRERKQRTTLADLLAVQPAAAAGKTKIRSSSDLKSGDKEKKKKSKSSLSSAAAERIRRMMTGMVKKKIHPAAAAAERKGKGAADVADDLFFHGGLGGSGGVARTHDRGG